MGSTSMRRVWIAVSLVIALFAAIPALLGRGSWWLPLLLLLPAVVLLLEPRMLALQVRRRGDRLQITDWGLRRELGRGKSESVAWGDLQEISVITTAAGPMADDLFFVLVGHGKNGIVVPHDLATRYDLLAHLQKLPRFDNAALLAALGSTEKARFLVWRATPIAGVAVTVAEQTAPPLPPSLS
jgi:hypothetical protein